MEHLASWNRLEDPSRLDLDARLEEGADGELGRLARFAAAGDIARLRSIDTFGFNPELLRPPPDSDIHSRCFESLCRSPLWNEPALREALLDSALHLGLETPPPKTAEDLFDGLPAPRAIALGVAVLHGPWTSLHADVRASLARRLAPGIVPSSSVALPPPATHAPRETLERADEALDPVGASHPSNGIPGAPPDESRQAQALSDFAKLFTDDMLGYSVEEIRRTLVDAHPFLTPAYVEANVTPRLRLDRPVDRYGPEPHFLFAAKLARFLYGAAPGSTEEEILQRFLEDPTERAMLAWRGLGTDSDDARFTPEDLERLRRSYPFVPRWEGGVKPPDGLMLGDTGDENRPDGHLSRIDYRAWKLWKSVDERIQRLASIPMVDPLLHNSELLLAPYRGLLDGARIVETSGTFADSIPWLFSMLKEHDLHGSDIHRGTKHYANDAHGTAIDLARRVFGARLSVVEGTDEAMQAWVTNTLTKVAHPEADDRRPLIVHNEGVLGVWSELEALRRSRPELPLLLVSHTTSDANDVVQQASRAEGTTVLTKLMGHAKAKRSDESGKAGRFDLTFTSLFSSLPFALPFPVREYGWTVRGYGNIGQAAARAASASLAHVAIDEIDPARQRQAETDGFWLVTQEGHLANQIIVSCTGRDTPPDGESDFAAYRGADVIVLVSLGSCRREFDMAYLERNSVRPPMVIGQLGGLPIVEYQLSWNELLHERQTKVIAIGDGFVGNLAFLHPSPAAYGATTPLVTFAAMLEGMDELRRGVTGAQPLHFLKMDDVGEPDDGVLPARRISFGPLDATADELVSWDEQRRAVAEDESSRIGRWLKRFAWGRSYVVELGDKDGPFTLVARRQV